jgi:hypothetical protein
MGERDAEGQFYHDSEGEENAGSRHCDRGGRQ